MGKFIDMTGQKFGRITILSKAGNNKHKKTIWNCICVCGRKIIVVGSDLKSGNTKSCGCLNKELLSTRIIHGMCDTSVYHIWQHIKDRCFNHKHPRYKDYGGRGNFNLQTLDGI